jgi:ATP-dependent HslUV protease subunit HslV
MFPHDGGVIAGSGAFGEVLRFKDWIVDGADPSKQPELKESDVIWIQSDGSFTEFDPSGRLTYEAPFYAIGSGREIAIGAMAAGATAEGAVRIACEWDGGTGGEVHVVRLMQGDN